MNPTDYNSFAVARNSFNDLQINLTLVAHEILRNIFKKYCKVADKDYIGYDNFKVSMNIDCLKNVMVGSFESCLPYIEHLTNDFLNDGNMSIIESNIFEDVVSEIVCNYEKYNKEYGISIADGVILFIEVKKVKKEDYMSVKEINFYFHKPKNLLIK